jgi:hypothetical protein
MPYDALSLVGITISIFAGSAAVGGWIAHHKRRSPVKGVLTGLLLGPIGILIELRAPYIQRPLVDENAWNSLQSMLVYQKDGREYRRRRDRLENPAT